MGFNSGFKGLTELIIPAFYSRSSELFCRTRMDGKFKKTRKTIF